MRRRQFSIFAAASVAAGTGWAQTKPLRLVVPFPPGGATDITARSLADPLARELGQPVVVDNRSGAGGSIGMTELAKAAPDGNTFGLATLSTHGVNPAVYKKLPYDPIGDFVAVTEVVKAPGVLVVHPSVAAKSVSELIELLKANPGRLTYASPGNGTIGHMWGELFKSATSTFMLHIPYRGAAPALNDLLAGQVQVYFDQVASSLPHIQSGKLRALAVSWNSRLAVLPGVPTYDEVGLRSNNDPSWFGIVAPARTAPAAVRRMQEAIARIIKEPAVADRLAGQGLFPSGTKPEEFATQVRNEIAKMKRISEFAKITLD